MVIGEEKVKENKPTITDFIWLFILGCVLGFILETGWYYIKHGVWINKQGLLYGPFKPIYGFGLDIIVLGMYKFREHKLWVKFIIGVLLGSLFEYFGSLFQEYIFGTATWSYASFNYNIGGRIYIPYCLAWGVIAVLCIDYIYPWFKKKAHIAPKIMKEAVTIIVTVLMLIDMGLTILATVRYSARAKGDTSNNVVLKFIDKTYNDSYMKKKFPKLRVVEK